MSTSTTGTDQQTEVRRLVDLDDLIVSDEAAEILGWSGSRFRTAVSLKAILPVYTYPSAKGPHLFSRRAIETIRDTRAAAAEVSK